MLGSIDFKTRVRHNLGRVLISLLAADNPNAIMIGFKSYYFLYALRQLAYNLFHLCVSLRAISIVTTRVGYIETESEQHSNKGL